MLIISPGLKTLLIFGAMKVIAFFMIVCLGLLAAFPVKATAMRSSTVKNCCHGMEKKVPSDHKQKDDCSGGMCNVILSCPACSFLTADTIMIKPLIPTPKESEATPYHI